MFKPHKPNLVWFIINSSFSVSNLTVIRPWPQSNLETSALTLWSRWFSSFSLRTTWWTVWCWWYGEGSRQRPCSHTVACCLGKTPPPVHKNTQIKAQWMNPTKDFSHLSWQYVYIERHTRKRRERHKVWPWGVDRRGSVSCGRLSRSSGSPASSWT